MIACVDDMGIVYPRTDVTYIHRASLHTVHTGFDGWRNMSYGLRESRWTYSIYFVSRRVLR